jgi:trehalose/maltose hydrolase-like predicted phosphorylase
MIHLGAMTGTLNIMQMRCTGLHFKDNRIYLNPNLPDEIKSIKFKFFYHNHLIILFIDHEKVRIEVTRGWTGPLEFLVNGEKIIMDNNVVAEIRQEKEKIPEPDKPTEIRMVSDDV